MIVQNIDLVAAPAVTLAVGLIAAIGRQAIVNELTNKFELARPKMRIVMQHIVVPYACGGKVSRSIDLRLRDPHPYWTRLWNAVRGR
jgi:hypothetical protein